MATLLQSSARTFWDGWLRDHGGYRPTTMHEFYQILRQRFLSPMLEKQARAALWQISQRQQESVHAFNSRFQNHLHRLTTYDPTDIMERFVRALRPELRMAVAQREPNSIQQAMYIAEHLELLTATYVGKPSTSTQATSSTGPAPNQTQQQQKKKAKGQQTQSAAFGGQQGGKGKSGQATGGQQKRKSFPPCPICKKPGHSADYCWSNPNSSSYRGSRAHAQGQARGQPAKGQARAAALAPVAEGTAPQQQGHPQDQHHPRQGNATGSE